MPYSWKKDKRKEFSLEKYKPNVFFFYCCNLCRLLIKIVLLKIRTKENCCWNDLHKGKSITHTFIWIPFSIKKIWNHVNVYLQQTIQSLQPSCKSRKLTSSWALALLIWGNCCNAFTKLALKATQIKINAVQDLKETGKAIKIQLMKLDGKTKG